MKKICIILLLFLCSCGQKFDPEDFFVHIESGSIEKKGASGVIVSEDTVLTVAHGIVESPIFVDGKKASIKKKMDKKDMLFLTANTEKNMFPTLGSSEVGSTVTTYSRNGKKVGIILKINQSEYFVDIVFEKADSGAGVYNEKNELIGIVGAYDIGEKMGVVYIVGE